MDSFSRTLNVGFSFGDYGSAMIGFVFDHGQT